MTEPKMEQISDTAPSVWQRTRRIVIRTLLIVMAVVLVAAMVGGVWVYSRLKGSLPQLEGERPVEGLSAPVTIERDALGVPTIRGANRADLARALGFLHGQDRFFQMDLLRRRAAGELAELFGAAALSADRSVRVHRFRARAREILASSPAEERAVLEAYTAGVNVGLTSLDAAPFEYMVSRTDPAPWRPEDSVLAVYAMYLTLQDESGGRESIYGVMHDRLPEPLYEFLAPRGTEWDAPVDGEPFVAPPIPEPEIFDLRKQSTNTTESSRAGWTEDASALAAGSNNWAVAGRLTAHGGALLANDMHLGISVPNTWYRASFVFPESSGERRITGVTLPGTPAIVVGSNGDIAWGFTNSQGDWSDLVILEPTPGDENSYMTPQGPRRFERVRETIRVKDGADEVLEVLSTIWGPVIDKDHRGRQRALRWVAHDRQAVNLGLLRLENVRTIEEAIAVANQTGSPAQNFVVVDSSGRIGWTIMGPIPRRSGYDGRLPQSWANGSRGWDGWLRPEEYPRIIDPERGRIWTANARVVSGEMLMKIGDGGYDLGARARQIRDGLLAVGRASEADLLKIQLDDRALFLERWRDLLLDVLTPEAVATDSRRRAFREQVENWGGRAAVDSIGYRLVRAFRLTLAEQVFGSLTAACKAADERFNYGRIAHSEGPLWRLVSERPLHLLDPRYKSWPEQFLAAVDATLDELLKDGVPLEQLTWGRRNTTQIQHPLSRFLPGTSGVLDMPVTELPGDSHMPRVQGPSFGASERLVVSPGREAEGLFHMPCGQSGHPLSPYYREGHNAWVNGEATPFLPGPTVHTLKLLPG